MAGDQRPCRADARAAHRDPASTNLFLGFDNPVAAPFGFKDPGRNLLSSEIGPAMAARIYLAVRRLAEATGAVQIANPETATGSTLSVDAHLDAIEAKIGTALAFPNFYPGERGLVTRRGIVGFRAVQAIYQAWRLSALGAGKVLEIGAGLGRTAYYAHAMGIRDYTIVDIPLSNVAQAHFLSRALGEAAVGLAGEERRAVRIVGPAFVDACDERFDVVLNADSLAELDPAAAASYFAFARRSARKLLSINSEWPGRPRTCELAGDLPRLRMPYWLRDGYVEEVVSFEAR